MLEIIFWFSIVFVPIATVILFLLFRSFLRQKRRPERKSGDKDEAHLEIPISAEPESANDSENSSKIDFDGVKLGNTSKIFTIFSLVSVIILILTSSFAYFSSSFNERWLEIVKIVFYVEILYFLMSLKKVGAKQLGAVLFFGKPIVEVGSGICFVPILICSLELETALTIQDQYPAEPEKVDKTSSDIPAPGKVFPMRVTHAAPTESKPKDAIDTRMTSEVNVIARFKIRRGEFVTFLTTIGGIEELKRTIRDTVEGGIKKEFAKRTPSKTLEDLETIDHILKDKVIQLTESWGVEIVDIQIVDVDLGKTVNEALRNVPAAILARQKATEDAEANRIKISKEGEGKADATEKLLLAQAKGTEAKLLAEAKGAAELAKVAQTSEGQVSLWLDTMRTGFEKSNHTIIPAGDLFSATSGVGTILEKIGEKKK